MDQLKLGYSKSNVPCKNCKSAEVFDYLCADAEHTHYECKGCGLTWQKR